MPHPSKGGMQSHGGRSNKNSSIRNNKLTQTQLEQITLLNRAMIQEAGRGSETASLDDTGLVNWWGKQKTAGDNSVLGE